MQYYRTYGRRVCCSTEIEPSLRHPGGRYLAWELNLFVQSEASQTLTGFSPRMQIFLLGRATKIVL